MKARMLENEQEMINMKKSYEEKLRISQKDSVVSTYCLFCKIFHQFYHILVVAQGRENNFEYFYCSTLLAASYK